MMNATVESWASELTDADCFRDPAVESLCALRDNTWVPPLTLRGELCPVRTVMYLAQVESGPKFRQPLKIEVSPTESGAFQVYSAVLDISGIGESLGAAASDLSGTVASLWAEFSTTPAEKLAPDAMVLYQRLRSVLG